jgi:hypothetical protein
MISSSLYPPAASTGAGAIAAGANAGGANNAGGAVARAPPLTAPMILARSDDAMPGEGLAGDVDAFVLLDAPKRSTVPLIMAVSGEKDQEPRTVLESQSDQRRVHKKKG